MTIFEAIKIIKEEVERGTDPSVYLTQLAEDADADLEKLETYYKLYCVEKENRQRTKTGMSAWHISEKILIMMMMGEDEKLSKTKLFKILSENQLINRSHSSITFYYYNDVADMMKERKKYIKEANLLYNEIASDKTEEVVSEKEKPKEKKRSKEVKSNKNEKLAIVAVNEPTTPVQKLDSLDHLTAIIQNVQHLEGFNLESFLGGLSTLTTLAVKENDTSELEELRNKTKVQEKEILDLKEQFKLEKEEQQKENLELKRKLDLVTEALNEYDSLDTLQQVAQLRGYTKQIRDSVK